MNKRKLLLMLVCCCIFTACGSEVADVEGTAAKVETSTTVEETETAEKENLEEASLEETNSSKEAEPVASSETFTSEDEAIKANINWIAEEKVKELRIAYYGSETLSQEKIDNAIAQEDTEYSNYRSDSKLSSHVATKGKYSTGITKLSADGTILVFEDIWKEDVDIFEILKLYLLEDTIEQVQNGISPLVTNYEEVIRNMDAHPEQWYWHMDGTGVVITFRKQIMRSAEFKYKLLYSEWQEYLKEEYLLNTADLIAQVDANFRVELDDGRFVEIVYDNDVSYRDVTIKTEKTEYTHVVGEDYYGYSNAYIFQNGEMDYYLLVETGSATVYEYGAIVAFHIVDGMVEQTDCLEHAGSMTVDGSGNIILYILGEGNKEHDYSWNEENYKLDNGKLLPAT